MEPNITTVGFAPTKAFLRQLQDKLFRFTDILPYDSSIAVRIEKRTEKYEFSVAIHFVGGKMEATSHGQSLKKATMHALDTIYKQVCRWHTERFKGEPRLEQPKQRTPTVLIIDDDPASVRFLDFCLRKNGCRTKSVSNGPSAVEEIAAHDYDLIFLDWNMPGMNGGETLLSAQNLISYDDELNRRYSKLRLPVITFSGKPKKDISVPQCRHFRFIDHWDKATPLHQLLSQASDVLFRFV